MASSLVHDPSVLRRSVAHMGSVMGLRSLVSTLLAGGGVSIGLLGASVAQAGGCLTQPMKRCMDYRGIEPLWNPVPPFEPKQVKIKGFLIRFLEVMNSTYPGPHQVFNGAADATPAKMIAECLFSHIPRRPHLVILEFGSMAKSSDRESVESIVRALLDVPSPPALVFLSVREWAHRRNLRNLSLYAQTEQTAWSFAEDIFHRICVHYGQTCLSYFEAVSPLLYGPSPPLTLADVASDGLHPSTGRLGIDFLTEMLGQDAKIRLAQILVHAVDRSMCLESSAQRLRHLWKRNAI